MTHICVGKLTIIGSDNGLSPERRQAIIWTNAGLLLIGPRGTNFSEISIKISTFSFKKMHLKVSSAKRRPFCPGLNVLTISRLCMGDQLDNSYFDSTVRCHYNFSAKSSQNIPHGSPVRARYGVYFVCNVWLIFCHCHRSAECNIVKNVTTL